jgi:sporulation delaying protein A
MRRCRRAGCSGAAGQRIGVADDKDEAYIMTDIQSSRGDRRLAVLAIALGCISALLVVYAVHSSLPFNSLRLPYEREVAPGLVKVIPESWKFFTRDPLDQRMLFYGKQADGSWKPANLGPNGRFSNQLGASRRVRAQGVEAGLLLAAIPPGAWAPCDDEPTACLDRTDALAEVHANSSPEPSLCGDIGIVLRKPLPWAWAKHPDKHRMPARIAHMRVSC